MAGRSSKKALDNRNARANYVLGLLGGVAVSPPLASKEAMQYYARSAAEGNPDAQYQLAKLLVEGQTLSTNNRAALKWLKKAVEKCHLIGYAFKFARWLTVFIQDICSAVRKISVKEMKFFKLKMYNAAFPLKFRIGKLNFMR